jgi:hypothetical protein
MAPRCSRCCVSRSSVPTARSRCATRATMCPRRAAAGRHPAIEYGTWEVLRRGDGLALLAVGTMVLPALEAAQRLEADGINASVVNCRFLKPLDEATLAWVIERHAALVTVEEGTVVNGFGASLARHVETEPAASIRIAAARRARRAGPHHRARDASGAAGRVRAGRRPASPRARERSLPGGVLPFARRPDGRWRVPSHRRGRPPAPCAMRSTSMSCASSPTTQGAEMLIEEHLHRDCARRPCFRSRRHRPARHAGRRWHAAARRPPGRGHAYTRARRQSRPLGFLTSVAVGTDVSMEQLFAGDYWLDIRSTLDVRVTDADGRPGDRSPR